MSVEEKLEIAIEALEKIREVCIYPNMVDNLSCEALEKIKQHS